MLSTFQSICKVLEMPIGKQNREGKLLKFSEFPCEKKNRAEIELKVMITIINSILINCRNVLLKIAWSSWSGLNQFSQKALMDSTKSNVTQNLIQRGSYSLSIGQPKLFIRTTKLLPMAENICSSGLNRTGACRVWNNYRALRTPQIATIRNSGQNPLLNVFQNWRYYTTWFCNINAGYCINIGFMLISLQCLLSLTCLLPAITELGVLSSERTN